MSDRDQPGQPLNEARIAALLQHVGERPQPSEAAMARARQAVHEVWQAELAQRRAQRRRWTGFAAAASVVLVLGLMFLLPEQPSPPELRFAQALPGGSLEWRRGTGEVAAEWVPLSSRQSLSPGDAVRTARDSVGALAMTSGAALRLDEGSELEITSGDEVFLRSGAVYVDAPGAATLAIRTKHGMARDIGTRFEVRMGEAGWRVQVREGRVLMNDARAGEAVADAGERVLAQSSGFARESVSSTDESWNWTLRAAVPMAIEGALLRDYLAWWSRETGIAVRYQRPIDEAIAAQTQLHGSLEGLSIEDGFGAVTGGAGYRVIDRRDGQVTLAR